MKIRMKNLYYLSNKPFIINIFIIILVLNNMLILINYKLLIILILIILISNNININPLFINIFIILLTIIIRIKINFIIKNNWFSIIIFLVIIGGIIILFLYFNRFIINEEFKIFKSNFFYNNYLKIIIFTFINVIILIKLFKTLLIKINLTKINFYFLKIINNERILLIILNNKIIITLIIIIIYLLYSLIVITFLCINKNLSLRKII